MMNKINYTHINQHIKSEYTIVFLHEGLGCIQSWRDYPQILCDTLQVSGIVYDRAGYGESVGNLTKQSDNYLIEAADDLNTFLKIFKLNQIILYGHSDGGSIALAFAVLYQKKLFCIITEAAHVLNEEITTFGIKKAVKAFHEGKLSGLAKWHGNNYKAVFKTWSNTWLRKSFNLNSLRLLLNKIQVKQLIIQGLEDQYGSIEQIKTINKNTHGHSTIFTPQCSHAPFIESTSEVIDEVVKFINLQINENTQN